MAKLKESSMRMRYFASYIGIVFCACVLIGVLALSRAIHEINSASVAEYQGKMALAAEELEIQQEIFENISYRIKASTMYRPFFTYRNAYYETEIVQDIRKFKDYSPLIDEYYCLLLETNSVYSAKGKLTVDEFLKYRLQTGSEMLDRLFAPNSFHLMPHPTLGDTTLMAVLPFRVQTDGRRDIPDTCLILMFSRSTLADRLEEISALSPATLTVCWQDMILTGDPANISPEALLSVSSESGDYTIYSSLKPGEIYQRLNSFSHYFLVLLTAGTLVLLLAAAFIAHRSYRPIERIISHLNIPQSGSAEDIESAVKALQDTQRYTKEKLQSDLIDIARQRQEIARQLLFAKLHGIRDAHLDALMTEAGIALNHSLFCVLLIRFHEDPLPNEKILSIIHTLADDDLNIYSAGIYQGKNYVLLLNFKEAEQLDEICTVMHESLEVDGKGAEVLRGEICEDMGQLPVSFVGALMRQEAALNPSENGNKAILEDGWYDDRQVCQMMQALQEGNSLKVQTCLSELSAVLQEKYPSLVLQRCIWADIGNHLLKVTHEMGISIPQKDLHMLLMAGDTEQFTGQLSSLLDHLIASSAEKTEQENAETKNEVVAYIESNLFSSQFTIYQAASHFGLSERKIGNIVRQATGIAYKEFIIQLRMERAKMLLTAEHYNVSQTGESVGYSNIPYFIKTFRNYTGFTPGEYKKLFEK